MQPAYPNERRCPGLIPVKVKEVVLDAVHNPLLLLVDMEETMVLPIGIGFWEAQAIVLKLQGHVTPRPMTHDLFKAFCDRLNVTVEKVVVNDIKDSTFYAEVYLKTSSGELLLDARPSDAIALSLTVGCPIYIDKKVIPYTLSIKELVEEQSAETSRFGDTEDSGPLVH
ncbi:MAG: bifunctional nuclease family protein [Firmicutes bacterium]|jgi:bifunctional DNase/RNase|nr:bifunctional nuclease family protein [Bacillota bacterium]